MRKGYNNEPFPSKKFQEVIAEYLYERKNMSTRYKHSDRVPSETLCTRLDELAHAVTLGSEAVAKEFTMRVPAELDRDADIVLSEAAKRIRELEESHNRLCK